MKYIIYLIFFSISSIIAKDTLTINDAIKIALEKNFSIRISKKNLEIADNNVSYGAAGMLPTLNANGSFTHSITDIENQVSFGGAPSEPQITEGSISKNYSAGVQMNWTIFDGLNMYVTYDRYEALKEKSEIKLQIAMQNLIRQLITVYYQAITIQNNLDAAKESIDISIDRLNRLKNKERFGAAINLEVSRAEVDLNTDSTNYLQLELALSNTMRNINFLLGNKNNEDYILQNSISLNSLNSYENLKTQTFKNNTSINAAIKNKEISTYDKRRIVSTLLPRINLNAGYNYSRQESDGGFLTLNAQDGFNIGVTASINLFNGMQTRTQIQNAEIVEMINDISIEQIKAQIAMNFDNAYENYQKSIEILNKEKENIVTAQKNFQRTEDLYKLGQVTSLELREAQRNLLLSRYRLNNAKYQTKLAETELLILSSNILN